MSEILLIAGMFAVTYSIRYLPFAFAHKSALPAWLSEFLSYVPVAALTAIIAPVILLHNGEIDLSSQNIYLIASLVAGLVAYMSKTMHWTVISGLGVFVLLKFV